MSQFAITEDCPRDCNGSPIRLGQKVWVANGWTGTTVNPWSEVIVDGIQCINGRYWIDIAPNATRSIPSYACSVEKVWQLAKGPPKKHQATKGNQMNIKRTPNAWSAACFSLHYVICDGCVIGCDGKGFSRKDAIYLAKKDGWKQVSNRVLCPTCAEEAK